MFLVTSQCVTASEAGGIEGNEWTGVCMSASTCMLLDNPASTHGPS